MYCSTLRGADWVEQYNSTVLSTALLLYCSTALLVERGANWVEQYNSTVTQNSELEEQGSKGSMQGEQGEQGEQSENQ